MTEFKVIPEGRLMLSIEVLDGTISIINSFEVIGNVIIIIEIFVKGFIEYSLIVGQDISLDIIFATEVLFQHTSTAHTLRFLQCLRCWSMVIENL